MHDLQKFRVKMPVPISSITALIQVAMEGASRHWIDDTDQRDICLYYGETGDEMFSSWLNDDNADLNNVGIVIVERGDDGKEILQNLTRHKIMLGLVFVAKYHTAIFGQMMRCEYEKDLEYAADIFMQACMFQKIKYKRSLWNKIKERRKAV